MRVSRLWLRELTGSEMPATEMARLLTAKGIAVEEITRIGDGFGAAKVAEVVEVGSHRLTLFDGRDVVEIEVETASLEPDCRLALRPGGKDLLREADVGFGDSPAPVILPPAAETGNLVRECIDDDVLVVELPPSRGDLTGIIGIAREFACFAGLGFKLPPVMLAEDAEAAASCFRLDVRDRADTPDYIARVVRDVRVAPSPFWLKWRLLACGIRAISNAVDVTNYIMFKYGQPLHGFDYRGLQGGMLMTRRARKGERLVTIDGIDRELDERVLVIADEARPVALAGVMGGRATEVTDATRDVLIECARFQPAVIRHGSRAIGLVTEASQRFELGIDPGLMEKASLEAAAMMREVCGGRALAGTAEVRSELEARVITVSWERTRRLLGMALTDDAMAGVLRALGFGLSSILGGADVQVPSFRFDVEGAADLAEEIGRVSGYDGIPSDAGYTAREPGARHAQSLRVARVRELMIDAGFSEVQTSSMLAEDVARDFGGSNAIRLLKPLNERYSVLRPSLLPNLLEAVSLNLRRGTRDLRLFELGTVFGWSQPQASGERQPVERLRLTAAVCGNREPLYWGARPEETGFFDMKGVVSALLRRLGLANPVFVTGCETGFAADASAQLKVGEVTLGCLGLVAGMAVARFDLSEPVFALDLDLAAVLAGIGAGRLYEPLPRFPAVKRDYAFVVAAGVTAGALLAAARKAAGSLVEEMEVFDRFQGKSVTEDRQSIGLRLTLRAPDRTLTAEEVDGVTRRLVSALDRELGARLRA